MHLGFRGFRLDNWMYCDQFWTRLSYLVRIDEIVVVL